MPRMLRITGDEGEGWPLDEYGYTLDEAVAQAIEQACDDLGCDTFEHPPITPEGEAERAAWIDRNVSDALRALRASSRYVIDEPSLRSIIWVQVN